MFEYFSKLIFFKQNSNIVETKNSYSDITVNRKEVNEVMKKVFLGTTFGAMAAVGLAVIWNIILSFIGDVFSSFANLI